MNRTDEEILKGQEQANAERKAEWIRVKALYPLDPADSPEVQQSMKVAREVAMLDP